MYLITGAYLITGIGLRALAQRDPVVEYQHEGFDLFVAMLEGMKEECVGALFNAVIEAAPAPTVAPAATAAPVRFADSPPQQRIPVR